MIWNWQQPDWPHFTWNKARFAKAEEIFLVENGALIRAGERRHAHYLLAIPLRPVAPVMLDRQGNLA